MNIIFDLEQQKLILYPQYIAIMRKFKPVYYLDTQELFKDFLLITENAIWYFGKYKDNIKELIEYFNSQKQQETKPTQKFKIEKINGKKMKLVRK